MGPDTVAKHSTAPRASARRRVRPGQLDLYLIRGVAGPFVPLLVAVTVALLLERALRLMHELAASGADLGYFFPLLLQLVPYYLELAVPLAFMVALVLMVAKLDERLELEAMLAAGASLTRIAAPLVAFGFALAALALVAGGWLEPIGRHGQRTLKVDAVNSGKLGTLQPLALFQPDETLAVTFDERAPDGSMRGMFLWQQLEGGEELVVSGGEGRVGFAPRERLFGIDFAAGRYVTERAGESPTALDFDRMAFREGLQLRESGWQRGSDAKELTLSELIGELDGGPGAHPLHLVEIEIFSRLARALLIPLVPLIVLPLAFATKKGGRSLGVLVCVTFVALSRHIVGFANNMAEAGAVSPFAALMGTIAGLTLFVLLLFASARNLPSHSPVHALLNPLGRGFGRLVPRLGAVPGLRGHSLTGYLMWELGKWILLALATLALFLQAIDLVEHGDEFVGRGFGPVEIGRYAALKLPVILQQAAPIAALGGFMAALALLAARREVTGMRAAGVSQWRVLAKAAPAAAVLAAATFALAEWGAPASQVRLAGWWAATEPAATDPPARWFRIGDDIVRAQGPSDDGGRLGGVSIYSRDGEGRLAQRIVAKEAVLGAQGWELRGAKVSRYASGRVERARMDRLGWPVPLQREDIAAFFSDTATLSSEAALRMLAQQAPANRGEAPLETRVHRSAAEPLAPFAMLLFALPIAFVAPRTGRAWPAVLYAGGAGLIYLVGDGTLTVAAQLGYVPPLLGAWAAPLLAILIGLTVLIYSER